MDSGLWWCSAGIQVLYSLYKFGNRGYKTKRSRRIKTSTRCYLIFYCTSYRLNMFRALLCPSSGASDYDISLPHWSFRSWFAVCWRRGVVRLEWCLGCRLKHNSLELCLSLQPGHHSSLTAPHLQHTAKRSCA